MVRQVTILYHPCGHLSCRAVALVKIGNNLGFFFLGFLIAVWKNFQPPPPGESRKTDKNTRGKLTNTSYKIYLP